MTEDGLLFFADAAIRTKRPGGSCPLRRPSGLAVRASGQNINAKAKRSLYNEINREKAGNLSSMGGDFN